MLEDSDLPLDFTPKINKSCRRYYVFLVSFQGARVGGATEPTFSRGRGTDAEHRRRDQEYVDSLRDEVRRRGRDGHQLPRRERGDFSSA